eukprot:jgi/Orpsp1_1/1182154/evm.model.c7180000080084.2
MASLYGDLPPPETKSKGSKDNNNSKSSNSNSSSQSQTKISKLYNFSPTTKSTVKSIKKPIIPASWTSATQFKPTQRKPITKPKTTIKSSTSISISLNNNNNNNENIPIPTIISTEIITKKKDTVIDNNIIEEKQNNWLKSNVTSKKRKQNNAQNKKSMNMEDLYDPKYPNEYEVYKKEKKMKKRIEKERREMEKKMEREMRHSHHHHRSHHNSPPPQPIPIPQPVIQQPVIQSKDMTGEEAYLMRARLSNNPVQPPPIMQSIIPPSRVVLLTNLVGAGEVDDALQEETAEECEKYGVVERCLIYEVKGNVPDDEAVRIFIKFSKLEEANKGNINIFLYL